MEYANNPAMLDQFLPVPAIPRPFKPTTEKADAPKKYPDEVPPIVEPRESSKLYDSLSRSSSKN